jgi:sporulation protein YlmC with PRC-barrel domain
VPYLSKPQKEKNVTKDKLIGMKVIDGDGNLVGTVKDVAFTIGKTGISLSVENKSGENQEVPWEDIQAAGDFIILKPTKQASAQPQQEAQQICPTCKGPLSYIKEYQRWYCYKCQKYI